MSNNAILAVLSKSLAHRLSSVQKRGLEVFRLYNMTNRLLPLIIDIYEDNAVIHVFEGISQPQLKEVESSLQKLLKVRNFFYKDRTRQELKLPVSPHKEITVKEYGHKFHINLSDYLDTGLFLDHRETRAWIGERSRGKVVLNTFAYTGSFTVYAAAGGAAKTYSVDLSKTYCEWIKKNLELNDLPPEKNWVYKMDTLEFFSYAKKKGLTFDIIIIDPPTFSKNKGKNFSVQKDHPRLINAALEVLAPGGFILFSNNYKEFKLNRKALGQCTVQEKTDTIPRDFAGSVPHRCFIIKHA